MHHGIGYPGELGKHTKFLGAKKSVQSEKSFGYSHKIHTLCGKLLASAALLNIQTFRVFRPCSQPCATDIPIIIPAAISL
jgi:hypothetical protein